MSRARLSGISERMMFPRTNPGESHNLAYNTNDELPKTVARTLEQGSVTTSMDFHPFLQTLLLVGTHGGDIALWEVSCIVKLVSKNFQVWDIGASTMRLKVALIKDPGVSVKRVLWSTDGSLFGVAYSKHLVQLYTYFGGKDIRQHLEIDSHVGSVNDLAFCNPNKQLYVITCGDDKVIRVWDVATGKKLYTFEGHQSPVHSVCPCPYPKGKVHILFSTSVDGKIKAWSYGYGLPQSEVDYEAPGLSCTTMNYSADGIWLFACGTNKQGRSHIVGWNQNERNVKRTYQGFHKRSLGIVQFDTSKNRFLAVGDDYSIKFWDMYNANLLTTIAAEGGLPASPRIRFNKEGTLLAVSANDNKIKILTTDDGLHLMHTFELYSVIASRIASETLTTDRVAGSPAGTLKTTGPPVAVVANGPAFGLSGRSPSIDLLHLNQSSKNENKGLFEPQNEVDNRSDGHILRLSFDDWPRSLQESENAGSRASSMNSATSLTISMPGNSSVDVSLKLSTGNVDEPGPTETTMLKGSSHY